MDSRRSIALLCLFVSLACATAAHGVEASLAQGAAADAGRQAPENKPSAQGSPGIRQGSVGEMREWLNRRNVERKQQGLAIPDVGQAQHPPMNARLRPRPQRPLASDQPANPSGADGKSRGTPVLHIGRGPDGRIHHRYIIKEEGPDELQVYSGSGHNPLKAETDEEKWARLTPRGRQLWFGGSSPRSQEKERSQPQRER